MLCLVNCSSVTLPISLAIRSKAEIWSFHLQMFFLSQKPSLSLVSFRECGEHVPSPITRPCLRRPVSQTGGMKKTSIYQLSLCGRYCCCEHLMKKETESVGENNLTKLWFSKWQTKSLTPLLCFFCCCLRRIGKGNSDFEKDNGYRNK